MQKSCEFKWLRIILVMSMGYPLIWDCYHRILRMKVPKTGKFISLYHNFMIGIYRFIVKSLAVAFFRLRAVPSFVICIPLLSAIWPVLHLDYFVLILRDRQSRFLFSVVQTWRRKRQRCNPHGYQNR